MKNVLIGIFAHPDDEAFGPSGTLLKLAAEGYDIHLILLTDGDAGVNIDQVPDLGATRLQEWQTAAAMIPVKSTHALHYPDGSLDTIEEVEIMERVKLTIREILNSYEESPDVSFMTFEPNGLTGHRDHITTSYIATTLATVCAARKIWYFCLDKTQAPLENTRYYEPRAREDDYITDRIDVSSWVTKKIAMMDAHVSQRGDAAAMKKLDLSTECFHIDTF